MNRRLWFVSAMENQNKILVLLIFSFSERFAVKVDREKQLIVVDEYLEEVSVEELQVWFFL